MEWLKRLWDGLIRDVILTLGGLGVIGSQVIALHPNIGLIGAGLAMTTPSTYANLKRLASGSPGQPPSQPGPEPQPPSLGDAGELP